MKTHSLSSAILTTASNSVVVADIHIRDGCQSHEIVFDNALVIGTNSGVIVGNSVVFKNGNVKIFLNTKSETVQCSVKHNNGELSDNEPLVIKSALSGIDVNRFLNQEQSQWNIILANDGSGACLYIIKHGDNPILACLGVDMKEMHYQDQIFTLFNEPTKLFIPEEVMNRYNGQAVVCCQVTRPHLSVDNVYYKLKISNSINAR